MVSTERLYSRLLLTLAVLYLTACGGSDSSRQSGVSLTPDSVIQQLGSPVDIGDIGDITDIVNIDVPNPGFQEPLVRTLNWPADFPADIRAGLTDTVLIKGLPTQSAYDFDVTLPASVDAENTTLFVLNLSEDEQEGGQVCIGDPDCTGTVVFSTVSLQLVSFDSGTASVSITPSTTPALVNEGTSQNPVELLMAGDELRVMGTVGAPTQTSAQIIGGESYYRIEGLVTGYRYQIELDSPSDNDVVMELTRSNGQEAPCDPSYSGGNRCVLIAAEEGLLMNVDGARALFGASYDIKVSELSTNLDFEGAWNAPLALAVPDESLVYHFGQSDQYSSYYSLTGLDASRRYRIRLTGNTAPVRLKLNSPVTSLPVNSPQCSAIDDSDTTAEQVCIIEGAIYTYFRVESVDSTSSYLLSMEADTRDEGAQAEPVVLPLDDQSKVLYHGSVASNSFYEVTGLLPDVSYLVQANGATRTPRIAVQSGTGAEVNCGQSSRGYCMFTATESTLSIQVTDTDADFGQGIVLSILPIDPSDLRNPAPAAENMQLQPASLPYVGTVDDFYSNYSVVGLAPEQMYTVYLSNNSEPVDLFAWPGQSNTIDCRVTIREIAGSGCLVEADSSGAINIRVGGDTGAQFTLDVLSTTLADNYRNNQPRPIPDNSEAGVVSSILVDEAGQVEIVEVELQIAHNYTSDIKVSLQAPDGRIVVLADHPPGRDFTGTVFSDLAPLPNPASGGYESHAFKVFRPVNPLYVLRGLDKSGVWTLSVNDDVYTNRSDAIGGILLGWALRFRIL
jgi:subtilisin-like proprotein convertase family protein